MFVYFAYGMLKKISIVSLCELTEIQQRRSRPAAIASGDFQSLLCPWLSHTPASYITHAPSRKAPEAD